MSNLVTNIDIEIDNEIKKLQALFVTITTQFKENPKKILEDLEKANNDLDLESSTLKEKFQLIKEVGLLVEHGIYYDPLEAFPTSSNKPEHSYIFVAKNTGTLDGIFYDEGDIVFYSKFKKRIYVLSQKDYVSSITLPNSKEKLTGDIYLQAKDLGFVEKPSDPNTPYLRKGGRWVELKNEIKNATTTQYGYAKQSTDKEAIDGKINDAYITLKQVLDKLNTYVKKVKTDPKKYYLISKNGLIEAPPTIIPVNATYDDTGLVKFATPTDIANKEDLLAVSPQDVKREFDHHNPVNEVVLTNMAAGSNKLPVYGRLKNQWVLIASAYDPQTFNLNKATAAVKGVVRLATLTEIHGKSKLLRAVSAEVFHDYINNTPLNNARKLTATGDYILTSTGWEILKEDVASVTQVGLMQYETLQNIQNKNFVKIKGVTQDTLEKYLATKISLLEPISDNNPSDTLYGLKNGAFIPLQIVRGISDKATEVKLGLVKKATYTAVKKFLEKILANKKFTTADLAEIEKFENDVIDFEFIHSFLDDFKIADYNFTPPDNKQYAIYNGNWIEINPSNNSTQLEDYYGAKTTSKETTTYIKKDLPPSDKVGVNGDICFVLNTHSTPLPFNTTTNVLSPPISSKIIVIKESYYLDKTGNQWIPISHTYVKATNQWKEVKATKFQET
jgi:hypothetical protein